ncbi:hypothetical protein [Aureivirga marina]|uniref:hypothetical protein n=1 Tax=Aureivirga marina TaxID=1182451 RepID=UPI0018CB7829|nr:hypothetical protein [Aureivirga marina]
MGKLNYLFLFLFLSITTVSFGQKDLEKIKEKIIGKWKHDSKELTLEFVDHQLLKTSYGSDVVDNDDYFIDKKGKEYILSIRLLTGRRYKYVINLKGEKLKLTPLSTNNSKANNYTKVKS